MNPIATLMLAEKNLLSTQAPVLSLNERGEFLLFSHIAKDNPQYKYLEEGKSALIIFESLDHLISPFNNEEIMEEYSAVHINGSIKIQSEKELKTSLIKTFQVLREYYNCDEKEYPLTNETIEKQLARVTGFYCKPSIINPIIKMEHSY